MKTFFESEQELLAAKIIRSVRRWAQIGNDGTIVTCSHPVLRHIAVSFEVIGRGVFYLKDDYDPACNIVEAVIILGAFMDSTGRTGRARIDWWMDLLRIMNDQLKGLPSVPWRICLKVHSEEERRAAECRLYTEVGDDLYLSFISMALINQKPGECEFGIKRCDRDSNFLSDEEGLEAEG